MWIFRYQIKIARVCVCFFFFFLAFIPSFSRSVRFLDHMQCIPFYSFFIELNLSFLSIAWALYIAWRLFFYWVYLVEFNLFVWIDLAIGSLLFFCFIGLSLSVFHVARHVFRFRVCLLIRLIDRKEKKKTQAIFFIFRFWYCSNDKTKQKRKYLFENIINKKEKSHLIILGY